LADLATLGLVFETRGGEQAARVLDQVEQKARGAERATDGLSSSSRGAASATEQLLAAIQKSVAQMEAMMRAQAGAAASANDLARNQGAANAAVVQGYSVNTRYTASFSSMSAQISEATANTQRLGMATRQAGEAAESAAMDFATMYDAHDRNFAVQYAAAMNAATASTASLVGGQHRLAAGSRLATHEMINLSRQLGDVATMAAMGASPLMILTTQGAQVGEIFGIARQRGVGFTAALGQMGGAIGGILVKLLPVTIAVGAVTGAFALFERAVDKNTEGATTWGQTWQATVNVVGAAIMNGPIGEGLNWLGRMFGATLDAITGAVLSFADQTVGVFGAAYQLIVQNWRRLPQVFGVLMQATANAVIGRLETMINTGIAGINVLLKAADIDPLGTVLLPRVKVANAELAADFERLASSIEGSFRGAREGFLASIVAETERLAKATDDATDASGRHAKAVADQAQALETANPAIEQSIRNLEMLAQRNADLTMSPTQKAMAEQRRLMAEAEAGGLADVISATQVLTDIEVERARVLEAISGTLITMPDSIRQGVGESETLLDRFEEIEAATRGITWAVDDVARAIENKDWAGVFAGLLRTLERVKELWNSNQPGGKMSATGAVLGQVGGAVGGTAGTVISGIGSGFSAAGAAAGMAGMGGLGGAIAGMAGPIGIAVAGFSILSKVLSDGAAKRRAKAEQEANDIARARQIAEERANKRAELEIELLRAQGDEIAALTRERENELKALDSVSAAIQRQIYALEDWQKTVTDAESAVAQAEADLRRAYDTERDRLLGIIGGVDEARQALEQAYSREKAAIEATVSGVEGLIESLRDFRQELNLNPLAQGSLAQGRGAALAQFQAAAPGDAPGAGRAFLDASMASARTALDFQRDRALVARAIDDMTATAEMQLTDAEKQLAALDKQVAGLLAANDNLLSVEAAIRNLETAEQAAAVATAQLAALDAQVGALINLNAGFMSVAQAIDNLASAQQALAAAQAAKPDTSSAGGAAYEAVGFDGYVDRNADLAALYAAGTGMARGRSKTEFGQYHWERYGQAEDRFYRPFANGGMFGGGGVVMDPTAFPMGQMAEAGPEAIMPLANVGGKMGVVAANDGLKEEVRALRQEMAAMRSASERTARATEDSRDVLEGAARGQLSITTEAA
jgi:hypothetical protein